MLEELLSLNLFAFFLVFAQVKVFPSESFFLLSERNFARRAAARRVAAG